MKKPIVALGLAALAFALPRLPKDRRERLSRAARAMLEHSP